ncbi:MAG: transcriptional regulator [Marinobacterium sp.]|nr:transcriptional regulator [Marinobacterium sp.]
MPLTRDFRETVMEMAKDPEYRQALVLEAIDCFLDGEFETGKHLLRDYLNATQAFPEVAEALHKDVKSLRRMVSPQGNPTSKNLLSLIKTCRQREGLLEAA